MTIDKAQLRRPIADLVAKQNTSNAEQSKVQQEATASEASVQAGVRPDIESSEEAEKLGQLLIRQFAGEPDKAIGAVGSLDEDRVADLLKD